MSANKLNDLDGKEWIKFLKSWKVYSPKARSKDLAEHPAKFPEELCHDIISFFTKRGGTVLDPYMGTGTALHVARQLGRVGMGIELNPHWFQLAAYDRAVCGDAWEILEELARQEKRFVDLVLTSPPYFNMLSESRGNSESQASARKAKGLEVDYEAGPWLEGTSLYKKGYNEFLMILAGSLLNSAYILNPGGHLVVIVQNFLDSAQLYRTFAWDLANVICAEPWLQFMGEKLRCQDDKRLGIWGYPSKFVLNIHHHYILIFRRIS